MTLYACASRISFQSGANDVSSLVRRTSDITLDSVAPTDILLNVSSTTSFKPIESYEILMCLRRGWLNTQLWWPVRKWTLHTNFSALWWKQGEHVLKTPRSEEHTSELQSLRHLVCR